jgi:hypothetical protein
MFLLTSINPIIKLNRVRRTGIIIWCSVSTLLSIFFGPWIAVPTIAQNLDTVAGTVFRDYNANGVRDAREPGVGGITVTAYDTNGIVDQTTSAADGSYTLTISTNLAVRVEFTQLPNLLRPGPAGADSRTTVAFATSPATNVDVGVNNPSHYCQDNPQMVTSCFVFGDQTGQDPALVTFFYQSGNDGSSTDPADYDDADATTPGQQTHGVAAFSNEVGSVFGLAYQRSTNSLFAAALTKRHAGFAPGNGPGTIYKVDRTNNIVDVYLDLNGLGFDAGANPHPVGTNFIFDTLAYTATGKIGLGDLDIYDEDATLYTINLQDRRLYRIPITNPPPGAGDIDTFPIPIPNSCNDLDGDPATPADFDVRPFAVGINDGLVYVGLVCSAQSTQDRADLRAYVYTFNPVANSGSDNFSGSPVLEFSLDYQRGCANGQPYPCTNGALLPTGGVADWQPWLQNDAFIWPQIAQGIIVYPQPILSDIEFDNGDLILGFRDRTSDQLGDRRERQPDPADPVEYGGSRPAGDILRACADGSGGWIIENDASCGGITTAGTRATNGDGVPLGYPQGPGGGEYYFWDDFFVYHDEITLGGLAQLPGADNVAVTVFDPVYLRSGIFDSGVIWFNNTQGTASQRYRVYVATGIPRPDNTFGKANGLGDLELLCNAAPIEIGNYIWFDTDADGVQDPDETPIAGVVVNLYDAQGTLIATTTTDGNGNYIFNADNVPTGLVANLSYFVAIEPSQFDAAGNLIVGGTNYGQLTVNNTGTGTSPDINDSDGLLGGSGVGTIGDNTPYIPVSLGPPGANDHTFDFGFVLQTSTPTSTSTPTPTATASTATTTLTPAPGPSTEPSQTPDSTPTKKPPDENGHGTMVPSSTPGTAVAVASPVPEATTKPLPVTILPETGMREVIWIGVTMTLVLLSVLLLALGLIWLVRFHR